MKLNGKSRAKFLSVSSALLLAFFLSLVAFYSVHQLQPPDAVPADASESQFSSIRAMEHLTTIAAGPHRTGSPQHKVVRDYLFTQFKELGLDPQIQKTQALRQWPSPEISSMYTVTATVENIMARLPGTDNSKAVLLMAHYDSVPGSCGASDDGAGIVTMLETLRALNAAPPLKNDVIFLVTDGEEIGLLGAQAFVDEHPWADDVGLVLNFEARGTSGPVFMFETSGPNAWLTAEFGKAAPYPTANSLATEVYKRMPNNTDLTVFKNAGLAGLNFAFIGDGHRYHTRNDNIENTNENSVQHHGSYALALTRHFGNLDLAEIPGGNAVYFNPIGFVFAQYSERWVIPLAMCTATCFLAVIVLGIRAGHLKLWDTMLGFVAFSANLIIAPVIVWGLIRMLTPSFGGPDWWLLNYNQIQLLVGFSGLTVGISMTFYFLLTRGLRIWHMAALAITVILCSYAGGLLDWKFITIPPVACALLYFLLRKPRSVWNLTVGGQLGWVVLMFTCGIMAPGASYMLTWPLLSAIIATGIVFLRNSSDSRSLVNTSVLTVFAIPGVLWCSNLAYLYFVAMGMNTAGITMAIVALLMSLLVPHCHYITSNSRWVMPGAATALGLMCILAATLDTEFDEDYPKPNSIYYAYYADSDQSYWMSNDTEIDEWTSYYLSDEAGSPEHAATVKMSKIAPSVHLAPPEITVTEDTWTEAVGIRTLKLHLVSRRHAPELAILFKPNPHLVGAQINGAEVQGFDELDEELAATRWWRWRYYALPSEGINLTLRTPSTDAIVIRLEDISYELPEIPSFPLKARPKYMIPTAFGRLTDVTKVIKTFEL